MKERKRMRRESKMRGRRQNEKVNRVVGCKLNIKSHYIKKEMYRTTEDEGTKKKYMKNNTNINDKQHRKKDQL